MAQAPKYIAGNGRLEQVGATHSVEEGCQARVKDPLWMLGRQWQMAEFAPLNGGQLARSEVTYQTTVLETLGVFSSTDEFPVDLAEPLESQVEREDDTPQPPPAWNPERLEYDFTLTDGSNLLEAREYDGNRLDWYSFDQAARIADFSPDQIATLRPAAASYPGMPHPRWWTFEEGQVDFGDVRRPYLNLLALLLMEFALIHSQDWYMIPIPHPVGSMRYIKRVRSIDNFGVEVEAVAVQDPSINQSGFELFTLTPSEDSTLASDGRYFYVPNNVWQDLGSEPRERVTVTRDELSNLVWAVEHRVQDGNGHTVERREEVPLAVPARPAHYLDVPGGNLMVTRPAEFPPGEPGNELQGPLATYETQRIPPPHWIPYLQGKYNGRVVLRRGRTQQETDPPQYKGRLLEESVLIAEDEVPRSGIEVSRYHQLARGTDGRRVRWLGRRKRPDVPKGPSDLRFDLLTEP